MLSLLIPGLSGDEARRMVMQLIEETAQLEPDDVGRSAVGLNRRFAPGGCAGG